MWKKLFLQDDILSIVNRLDNDVHKFSGKTVLIAGGCGFLGRYFLTVFAHLNKNVLENPVKIIVLDNFITSQAITFDPHEYPDISLRNDNICEPLSVDEPIDFIIQAAGIASPQYYRQYPIETLDASITGTRHLLALAKSKGARFTFFSSSEIYGDPLPQFVPMKEDYRGNVSTMGPRSCYDEGKRVGETLCYIYNENFNTHTNCIRPFNVYGPGMQEKDYRVMPNFASQLKGKQTISIYGTGKQTRTFTYVVDAMVGFFLVILNGLPGQVYNIGNPSPEISVLDLVKTMEKVLGRNIDYEMIEYPNSYPADEPLRRCPDISKARQELGFSPNCTLDEGLKKYLTWTDEVYVGAN
jgi:UDP-glucuronate decarboxylase